MACCKHDLALQPSKLPRQALYGTGESVGWQLSKCPFPLTKTQWADLTVLGSALYQFAKATETLYRDSVKGKQPAWIAALYDQGKSPELVRFSRMNAFKKHLPLVIRPDLLLTDDGWALCEIDSVPGGLGFTAALNQAYRESGFAVLETPDTLPQDFVKALLAFAQQTTKQETPTIAIILSDEAGDYRSEMTWLVDAIRPFYADIHLLHPTQVDLVRNQLVFQDETGADKPIHLIYRFFELFDLPNIPKMELIQYAIKKGFVACTPPFKPYHEEKLTLALFHHPLLTAFWQEQLGKAHYDVLKKAIPQGWVMDPTPLPPQAVIPNLNPGGRAVQGFEKLVGLSQKERELVMKPSGFSPLAWGSKGVTVGHDVSGEVWAERVHQALDAFGQTPHILQQFKNTKVTQVPLMPLELASETVGNDVEAPRLGDEPRMLRVRTRLCPYFFVTQQGENIALTLAGVLATSCPIDKKIIHGMKDAVLAPCCIEPDEA